MTDTKALVVARKLKTEYVQMWGGWDESNECFMISENKPQQTSSVKCPHCKQSHGVNWNWTDEQWISEKAAKLLDLEKGKLLSLILVRESDSA